MPGATVHTHMCQLRLAQLMALTFTGRSNHPVRASCVAITSIRLLGKVHCSISRSTSGATGASQWQRSGGAGAGGGRRARRHSAGADDLRSVLHAAHGVGSGRPARSSLEGGTAPLGRGGASWGGYVSKIASKVLTDTAIGHLLR